MGKIINLAGTPADQPKQIITPGGAPATPPPLPEVQFEPFDAQGYVAKCSEDPHNPGQFPIFTKMGIVIAVCNRPDIAVIICEALRLMALARAAQLAEEQKPE